jgi:integrase
MVYLWSNRLMPKRRGRGEGTIVQRAPGVWRLRAYAGRDPVTGKPHQVTRTVHVATKTEALKALRKFVDDVDTGKVRKVGSRATMEQLFEAWLEAAEGDLAASTVERYRQVVDKALIPEFGKIELRDLTAHHLDSYYGRRRTAGAAARTVRLHHSLMSGALSQAVRWEWIDRNVAALARPPAKPRGLGFIPATEGVRKLIEAAAAPTKRAPQGDLELVTGVVLAAVTGERRGELVGLQWADVNWQTAKVVFERQRLPLKGGDRTVPLKHEDRKEVALGPLGLAVLRRYRDAVEAKAGQLEVPVGPWLLSKDCGRSPLTSKWFGESITALGVRAGVPVTTHAFRRFSATQMVGAGVDVVTAAGRLGNSPDMLLRVYAGFIPSNDVAAAAGLDRLVLGPVPDAKKPPAETGG